MVTVAPRQLFIKVVGHEDRHSFRNNPKFPLGRLHPCPHPWPNSTFFRRRQELKRFRQYLREGLRDRDRAQPSNGTMAIPVIGTSDSPSPKFHGILTAHTDSPPTTVTSLFRQQHSSQMTWVSLRLLSPDKLTFEVFAKFHSGQSSRWQNYHNPQTTVPIPTAPIQQRPPPCTLSIFP